MSEFNFKSSISTSREQSERLLALGLKPETADCGIYYSELGRRDWVFFRGETEFEADEIPAWSLHRLIEMMQDSSVIPKLLKTSASILYDRLIDGIEWLIKEGYFNKEYLNGTTENKEM